MSAMLTSKVQCFKGATVRHECEDGQMHELGIDLKLQNMCQQAQNSFAYAISESYGTDVFCTTN